MQKGMRIQREACGLSTCMRGITTHEDTFILVGLRQEDFAVLEQLCAKLITYCLYPYKKCSCKTKSTISNAFRRGELTIIIILVIFEDMASKLEEIGPIFSRFNPFPSLPSAATDDRKQFQCRKIVFSNKTRPLFVEFN